MQSDKVPQTTYVTDDSAGGDLAAQSYVPTTVQCRSSLSVAAEPVQSALTARRAAAGNSDPNRCDMPISTADRPALPITERQRDVLKAIEQYVEVRGGSPTLDELRRMLGLASKSTVDDHLSALEGKGHIAIEPGAHAGITVLVPSSLATVMPTKPIRRAVLRSVPTADLEAELRRRRRAVR